MRYSLLRISPLEPNILAIPRLARVPFWSELCTILLMSGFSTQSNRRFLMKRSIFVLAMLVALGMFSVSYAADPMGKGAAQTVKGEILKVDGENYTIKDASGKEVRLHVDKTTKTSGALKVGDKIEAEATPEGHANSIKAAK
jgi:hypothetical protein